MSLLEELEAGPICADGAMGTLLMERGIPRPACLEELCVSQPDLIAGIHEEYLAAGARLIETNSFGANAIRLARHGLADHVNEINWQAAQIARQAARGRNAWVAGSVGPLGLNAEEAQAQGLDREEIFRTQIGALLDGGAQMIFLETFQNLEELLLALHVKQSLHHCPALCSVTVNADGRLADGHTIDEAFKKLARNDADILGLNCLDGPAAALRILEQHVSPTDLPLAIEPNAGTPREQDGRLVYDLPPEKFAEIGVALIARGARIVGGCCGTTPAHVAALTKLLAEDE